MTSQPFILPKSPGKEYVDALTEVILNSPEWKQDCEVLDCPEFIKDDIEVFEAGIADHKQALAKAEQDLAERRQDLAASYAKPCNDRRIAETDGRVEGAYETLCRGIDKSVRLHSGVTGVWITWDTTDFPRDRTKTCGTVPDAWRAAFSILDRRGAK